MQGLKHSLKKVFVSRAQLAHFSTLAKEKHMLLILNFSTLTFITNARTPMPFARLHSQMENKVKVTSLNMPQRASQRIRTLISCEETLY